MFTERTLIAIGFGTLGLCLLGIAYQIILVSQQVAQTTALVERVTALVEHLIKLH